MRRLFTILLLPIAVLALFLTFVPVYAEGVDADFNPHFLISDEEMQNANSLSQQEIQSFLSDHPGTLAHLVVEDKDGQKRRVSEMLSAIAQTYRISPKYLLVKLQKEQSLVDDPNPKQSQLDWATGYGICDACSTADPSVQKFKGFGIQLDSAAGIMRWYYDNRDTAPWIRRKGGTYTIDGTLVTPQSDATGFLYTYTPHLNGNKNFWLLWRSWFAQSYPDGTLLKDKQGSAVYVVHNGTKRPIASMAVLTSHYDPKLIIHVGQDILRLYPDGAPVSFPNYSILRVGEQYYLIDYATARPFASSGIVRELGYNPDEIIDATAADVSTFQTGEPITGSVNPLSKRLVKIVETGALYLIQEGTYHAIFDTSIAKVNFPSMKVESVRADSLAEMERGAPIPYRDGTLVTFGKSKEVYVIEHGKKRHIPSLAAFAKLGYNKKNIINAPGALLESYLTGQPIYIEKTLK